MITPIIAANLQQFVDKFGLNVDSFIAHAIAFTLLVAIVVKFGIKPIAAQLEERRSRIEEGEAMRAESAKSLAEVKVTSENIIADARGKSEEHLENARQLASHVQEESSNRAAQEAKNILENARKQAELEAQQAKDALRADFANLVAQATAQVTGKVLSESDHRVINEEAIKQL